MQISVYEVSVHQFILTLNNLRHILYKAQAYAEKKKIEVSVLLQTRLFPDMAPLGKQIQTTCDAAKFCGSRLTEVLAPTFEDNEQTLADYIARIDNTVEYLTSLEAEDFKNFDKKKIKFPWNPGQELTGKDYLVQFVLPNFYYHVTTAYNILRSCGIELGKADYLGNINWQAES